MNLKEMHDEHVRHGEEGLRYWRAWGSWFSWGSPVGLGLFIVSIAVSLLILHYAGIIG